MSQRKANPKLMRRPENVEARAIAACIKTGDDLLAMLADLPNDAQRAKACNLLMPHLPQLIHKRGTRLVIRIEEKSPRKEETTANPADR